MGIQTLLQGACVFTHHCVVVSVDTYDNMRLTCGHWGGLALSGTARLMARFFRPHDCCGAREYSAQISVNHVK